MDGGTKSATGTPQKDPLTGLLQQDYLFVQLSALLRRQRAHKVVASLALLQLENFYEIRRWVGKSEANLLLSDIASLLSRSLPPSVLLCRCAHYEFAALFLDESSVHAPVHIQRLKQALHNAVADSIPPQLELKCAVGLAQLATTVPTAEVLFARARHNLSLALAYTRRSGEPNANSLHAGNLQDDHGNGAVMPRAQLLSVLRNNQLALSFQAIVNLNVDAKRHYEVRCLSLAANTTIAAVFEAAVQNALGERIDRWVIARCLQVLAAPENDDLRLTINLSQNALVSTDFFPWLRTQLSPHADLSKKLIFQISELDLLTTQHHMDYCSRQLHAMGIKLGISDFGCTTDPFRYLPLLQAHYVKLDTALVEKIHVDPALHTQLLSITARLQQSGIRVIAPMVENLALVPLLWTSNVHLIQGYSLHEPGTEMNYVFLRKQTLNFSGSPGSKYTN